MAKKRKKVAIPKRIAGVKLPKQMRSGLRSFMASQSGRAVATEALLAVGAAWAAAKANRGSLRGLAQGGR